MLIDQTAHWKLPLLQSSGEKLPVRRFPHALVCGVPNGNWFWPFISALNLHRWCCHATIGSFRTAEASTIRASITLTTCIFLLFLSIMDLSSLSFSLSLSLTLSHSLSHSLSLSFTLSLSLSLSLSVYLLLHFSDIRRPVPGDFFLHARDRQYLRSWRETDPT